MAKGKEIVHQGVWGERFVKKHYESMGYNVIMNPNQFGIWDMFVYNDDESDAFTVQVKTTQRYIKFNQFTIHLGKTKASYLNLMAADKLVLVTRTPQSPHASSDTKWPGRVLEVLKPRGFTKSKDCYIIPSVESNFIELARLSDSQLNELNNFDVSKKGYARYEA